LEQIRISGRNAYAIAASVERQLHSGRAGAGHRLPTVRDLAATLHVSPATVAAAYTLLRSRGLIAGQGRRGTRVAARPPTPHAAVAPVAPAGTIDLATGDPDRALLPPIDRALQSVNRDRPLYGVTPVHPALAAFAAAEFEADGIPSNALAVVSGALDGVDRLLREHVRHGDHVAVEDPSYPGLIDVLRSSALVPVPVEIDDEGPVPESMNAALSRGCRALIVTPRAQNPTGAAVTRGRADDLQRVLRAFPEVLLIENDYMAPTAGSPAQTVSHSSQKHWAVLRSTSKFLGPDLRLAVMAGDGLTIARVQGRQALGARWVSHILQELVVSLWSDPSSGRWLARASELYAHRRTSLLSALRAREIDARGRSGYNVWIRVADEGRSVRLLAEKGWAVAAGERFRIQSRPAIRVTTAALEPADAGRLADDLAAAVHPAVVRFA
jgi:DNA-binding transcriptional MocR family regulator